MSWVYLVLAGPFEIGWPVGLKMAQEPETRWTGIAVGYWVHVCQRLLAVACAASHPHGNRLCCLDGYRQQIRERT